MVSSLHIGRLRRHPALNVLRHGRQRARSTIARQLNSFGLWRLRRLGSGRILSGPFSGTAYDNGRAEGTPGPKLLGTYEKEIGPALEACLSARIETFVDVGGGGGYYAVGLAVRMPPARVLVFESQATGRETIEHNARANGVSSRVETRGECRPESLAAELSEGRRDLLLMDVEGAEAELLTPAVLRRLQRSCLIIEAHDFIVPGVASWLRQQLAPNHIVSVVASRSRRSEDWPIPLWLPPGVKLSLMDERRPGPMEWVIGMPRETPLVTT